VSREHTPNVNHINLKILMTASFIFRMCRALMPGDDDSITDDAIWEALPVSPLLLHKIFEGLSLRLGSAALGLLLFDFAIF